ncbi:MAG: restriction endonuclease subunit S [Nitrospirae bacterium]|nr:MAG: restriction endonuclease subunit S [Nitrospirota bacterium]
MISELKPYPEYKDSGVEWLGKVPAHWEVLLLGRLGRLFKGNGGNKEDEVTEGIPCVRYGDLYTRHEYFIRRAKACIAPERAKDYTALRYGDVLFAASGETIDEIGRSAVNLLEGDARCGGDVLVLRPTSEAVPEFLGYASDSPASRAQKARMGRGFTVVHIYASQLKRLVLPLPPLPEQTAIVRFLDYVDRRVRRVIRARQRLVKLLEEYKQALIHQAVTGRIDVRTGQPYPEYKHSGVEWLGQVPAHWEVKPIGAFCPYISYGFTNPMPTSDEGPYLLTANDIGEGVIRYETARHTTQTAFDQLLTQKSRPKPGDVLVTKDGTLGRVAVADERPVCINQSVALLRVNSSEMFPQFLATILEGPLYQERMEFEAGGTTIKHIYITRLAKMRLAYPSKG